MTESIVNVSRCMKIREVLRVFGRKHEESCGQCNDGGRESALPESKVSHCRVFFPPPNVCRLPANYSCDGDRPTDRPAALAHLSGSDCIQKVGCPEVRCS